MSTITARRRREIAEGTAAVPSPPVAVRKSSDGSLGGVPLVAAIVGVGLVLCSIADSLSRATLAPTPWIYWAGVALITAPVFYRLCSPLPTTRERLALVCMLGLALYAVKLMRAPFGFTQPDEYPHLFNVEQILRYHHLFHSDSLLSITADYPGLEGATSALAMVTGMSATAAGIVVIGAARLMMMVGLFGLIGGISRSSRVAGLGAAIYAGNANFLLFGVQFAYESLALPLLVVILACIAARDRARASDSRAWTIVTLLCIAALVPTHHLTSYLLIIILVTLTVIQLTSKRFSVAAPMWPIALFTVVLTLAWLVVAASATVGYLSPVAGAAFESTLHTLTGESPPRAAFSGGGVGANQVNDLGEKVVGLASIAITLAAVVGGLIYARRRYRFRDQPLTLLIVLSSVGYFGATALRVAPAAWEIGNRLAEFLFVGVGFVIGSISIDAFRVRGRRWPVHAVFAAGAATIVVGGAILGWPANTRLANPLVVVADGHRIQSETYEVGRWVGSHLAPGTRFAAPEADAATLLLYGRGYVATNATDYADFILQAPTLQGYEIALWRSKHLQYAVVDLRVRSTDNAAGYFFGVHPPAGPTDELLPLSVATKFTKLPAPEVFDSGNIRVFNLQGAG